MLSEQNTISTIFQHATKQIHSSHRTMNKRNFMSGVKKIIVLWLVLFRGCGGKFRMHKIHGLYELGPDYKIFGVLNVRNPCIGWQFWCGMLALFYVTFWKKQKLVRNKERWLTDAKDSVGLTQEINDQSSIA